MDLSYNIDLDNRKKPILLDDSPFVPTANNLDAKKGNRVVLTPSLPIASLADKYKDIVTGTTTKVLPMADLSDKYTPIKTLKLTTELTGGDIFDTEKANCQIKKATNCGCTTKKSNSCGCGNHNNKEVMTVTGKILGKETSEAMVEASVLNVNTGKWTVADTNGDYVIDAEPDDIVEISFVGKKPIKMPASQLNTVTELEDDGMLDEVVVNATPKSADKKGKTWLWVSLGLLGVFVVGKAVKKSKKVNG